MEAVTDADEVSLFQEIGIPGKYLRCCGRRDRFIALVHRQWLKSLCRHSVLIDFIEKPRLEAPQTAEESASWIKIFVTVFKKRDAKVISLPRIRQIIKEDSPLGFSQLLQYISQTNYKNLWREAYKKYSVSSDVNKETQVTLVDFNDILKEVINRIYGCMIINTLDPNLNIANDQNIDPPINILPAIVGVETLNAIFLLHIPHVEHNLKDCVTFSPAILEKCYSKPLFIVYQLLQLLKSLHDRSLTLGNISLNDVYLTEDLWIYVFPQISSNIYIHDIKSQAKKTIQDCKKVGHKFDNCMKCVNCGLRTYDKIQVKNETLDELCKLWVEGKISNFTYISQLNKYSGRKLGDPNRHYVFPWVTDFASRCGKNWRDLHKSKFRLNKGDRQLDLTYDNSQTQVPHHVSDVLSPITYYVYMARKTPKSVLCKYVRTNWVPAEYPSSIQRMQEWTPDECIPEFFNDPSVFRSIHNDLDDLEVPLWAAGPEDFIDRHRETLESNHVSERLHHWIDLTFGYKLSGNAAVKAKNVCLHLADEHTNLTKSGLVQLFTHAHPQKAVPSPFFSKVPPKMIVTNPVKQRSRSVTVQDLDGSKEDEEKFDNPLTEMSSQSMMGLSKILSRSRSSLNDDQGSSQNRSPSASRSASLGPKNPSFTSHVTQKSKSNQLSASNVSLNTGIISLPKEYKPEQALENLEKMYSFVSKTFHTEHSKKFKVEEEPNKNPDGDNCLVPNGFTNFMFAENLDQRFWTQPRAKKSFTFPLDGRPEIIRQLSREKQVQQKVETIITCNYSEIISTRKIRELQTLGCLIVEIFLPKQLRALSSNDLSLSFSCRLKNCLTVITSCKNEIPPCISYIVDLLLQPYQHDLKNFSYPTVSDIGLPPPSAHLLLEPLLHCLIPFPKPFPKVYRLLRDLKQFKNVALELNVLYYFDCDGTMCADYENLEKTKILFAQNIAECQVKSCAKQFGELIQEVNSQNGLEIVNILLPYFKELLEDPPTSVLAAWYLFDPMAKALGTRNSIDTLLESVLKLYENDLNDICLPFYGKIGKLYHHSFLVRLMVRFGLKCFLDNFMTPLVEAVGGYKDHANVDFVFHNHREKILKQTSHLKNLDSDNIDTTQKDELHFIPTPSESSMQTLKDQEVFEFDEEKEQEQHMSSLIEHLELNLDSDLPFNHSTAEVALDATLAENIDQLKNLEELNLNLTDEEGENLTCVISPTIPVPASYHNAVTNISCDIGSRKSENELTLDSPAFLKEASKFSSSASSSKLTSKPKKIDNDISEMSQLSIISLSHRLGPVLMAKYLSRNLLKMLTLCYVGKDNLNQWEADEITLKPKEVTIASRMVLGDKYASKVLESLASIAELYGEEIIIFQYLPHIMELIALSKRKLTATIEGGLVSCLTLLKHTIPYLSDSTLMDKLKDIFLDVLEPTIRLVSSTQCIFPSGSSARDILTRKYIDTLFVISIRIGSDMSRNLTLPALKKFFLIFDNVAENERDTNSEDKHKKVDWSMGGQTIPHVRLKDSDSFEVLSPRSSTLLDDDTIEKMARQEIIDVFTPELAHCVYLPFLKHIGVTSLDIALDNHDLIRELCHKHEQVNRAKLKLSDFIGTPNIVPSTSVGTINVIGNRIDIQNDPVVDSPNTTDYLSLVSNRMTNNTRHLKGNWFIYWNHEIGRPEKDNAFNFKQIKLQTFAGHTNSVKCMHILDNENSFMSGSRDKTVKLWSLRSQGDGSAISNCQWTYAGHKKAILSLTFVDSTRLVASCDSVVHLWDPFIGVGLAQLESPKYNPVNVVKSMPSPSSLVFCATTEGTIKVIDVRLESYMYDLKITVNPSGLIRCLAVSPSGYWIAAGQSSGSITILDTRTGLVMSSWRAHEGEVLQIVAVDENTVVSSSLDQSISVWNVINGLFKHHLKGPTEPAHCLSVFESRELVTATTANKICVHSPVGPDATFSSTKLRGDTFKGLLTSTALLPLNMLLLLGADNGQISLMC